MDFKIGTKERWNKVSRLQLERLEVDYDLRIVLKVITIRSVFSDVSIHDFILLSFTQALLLSHFRNCLNLADSYRIQFCTNFYFSSSRPCRFVDLLLLISWVIFFSFRWLISTKCLLTFMPSLIILKSEQK